MQTLQVQLISYKGYYIMRRICLFLATITISIFSCITSFAGQWQSDAQGWWYVNDDGTPPQYGVELD